MTHIPMIKVKGLGRQRGLAAVEASIVLPIMLLLLMATGEFGRMLYQYNTLTKAVRAGAFAISRDGSWMDNPTTKLAEQDKIKNIIVYGKESAGGRPVLPGLSKDDIVVSNGDELPFGSAEYYSVIQASYDWTPVFGDSFNTFFGKTISLNFPLETSVTVRVK
jgi:hypothetical protein